MSDLTDFLLARIAEDEAAARYSVAAWGSVPSTKRALAECEAKRRIVERVQGLGLRDHPHAAAWYQGYSFAAKATLADLALSYADHPAYREEWRP